MVCCYLTADKDMKCGNRGGYPATSVTTTGMFSVQMVYTLSSLHVTFCVSQMRADTFEGDVLKSLVFNPGWFSWIILREKSMDINNIVSNYNRV